MRFFPCRLVSSFVALLFVAGCGAPKLPPEQAADQFFGAIQKGDTQAAYRATTFAFQAQQTLAAFDSKLRDLSLGQFHSIAWEPANKVGDNDVKLHGMVKRGEDEEFPIRLVLHRQDRRWLVANLVAGARDADGQSVAFSSFGEKSAFLPAAGLRLPPLQESRVLVAQTLSDFDAGLERNDFTNIYQTLSTAWQSQASSTRFRQAFEKFIAQKVRLHGADEASVSFDEPPRLQGSGVLLLHGHAATQPKPVGFVLKYLYEVPKWRLIGMTLNVDDGMPGAAPVPSKDAPSPTPAASPAEQAGK